MIPRIAGGASTLPAGKEDQTMHEYPMRGDIYYIVGDPDRPEKGAETWSDRPGIIISNDVLNRTSRAVTVAYLSTSKKRPAPTHADVTSGNKQAVAMCEQICTVDKSRLADYIGTATKDEMNDLDGAILFALQINKGKRPDGIFKKYQRMLELERQEAGSSAGN